MSDPQGCDRVLFKNTCWNLALKVVQQLGSLHQQGKESSEAMEVLCDQSASLWLTVAARDHTSPPRRRVFVSQFLKQACERHVIVFILTVSCACVGQALTPGPGAPGFEANHDVVRSSQTALDALSLVPRHRAQYDIVLKLSLITLAWPSSQANDTRFALVGAADSYLYTVPRPSCFHPRVRLLYDPQEDQLVDNRCSELSQCSTQMIMSQAEKLILSLNGRAKDGSNSATLKVRRLNSWVLNRF